MNNKSEIELFLVSILTDLMINPPETLDYSKSLIEQGLDDQDIFWVIFKVENYYDITITDKDLKYLDTINDLTNLIIKRRK